MTLWRIKKGTYPAFNSLEGSTEKFSEHQRDRAQQQNFITEGRTGYLNVKIGLDTSAMTLTLKQGRVVMLTSHTTEQEIIAALSSGADAYCIKGASVDRLLNAIAAAGEGAAYLDPQTARKVIEHLSPPSPSGTIITLSKREMEVLKLIVEGYSNPGIASALYLSPNTVKTHVRGIMNKLSVDDRVQAAVVALRSGLV
jgi:DNA-binding NarL/FixJ family response regulator